MPVYLITLHAYRSWGEDNPNGYYQRGERRVKKPDSILRKQRASLAKNPPRIFTSAQQRFIIQSAQEIAVKRNVRLHAASCTPTHAHMIVSWLGNETFFIDIDLPYKQARLFASKVKTVLATLLSKHDGTTGNRWFSRGCDCKPVEDREHLNYLIANYLPKHRGEGGIVQILDNDKTSRDIAPGGNPEQL